MNMPYTDIAYNGYYITTNFNEQYDGYQLVILKADKVLGEMEVVDKAHTVDEAKDIIDEILASEWTQLVER